MVQTLDTMRRNHAIDDAIAESAQRFTAARPLSEARHRKAQAVMPGGNTRAVLYYAPFPITMRSGAGARLTDLDGNEYVDFVSEYGAGILGHSNPLLLGAAAEAMKGGMVLGAPNLYEAELARLFVDRFPAVEMVRFCNSGTEANLLSLAAVVAKTGRRRVLVFRDGYHGGIATFAHGGSPLNMPFDWVFGDYNDIAGTKALIGALGDQLATVIVEPVMGGGGSLPADPAFLHMLRAATQETGACMILDEVITSRLAPGGVHGTIGLKPDLVTFGKYLGGGFTFGAFGGAREIMSRFDPTDPNHFSHGGTFNNNVVTMAAGVAALSRVFTPEVCIAMNRRGDRLRQALATAGGRHRVPVTATGLGSVLNIHFQDGPVTAPQQILPAAEKLQLYAMEMMQRGFYVTPRGMINLNIELTDADCDAFVAAFDGFLGDHAEVLRG